MKAPITKIIDISFVDGPGSRTAIFFQGCNLDCLYCHNPETKTFCNACDYCNKKYIKSSVHSVGSYEAFCMGVSELVEKIKQNQDFIEGITLSGGECTLYAPFVLELLRIIKEETALTTMLDTNALFSEEFIEPFCAVTDGFLVDLKAFDSNTHIKLTGKDNKQILRNITKIASKKLLQEVRTVLVEGFNDTEEEILKISNFLHKIGFDRPARLIPFRPHGVTSFLKNYSEFDKTKFEELQAFQNKAIINKEIKL